MSKAAPPCPQAIQETCAYIKDAYFTNDPKASIEPYYEESEFSESWRISVKVDGMAFHYFSAYSGLSNRDYAHIIYLFVSGVRSARNKGIVEGIEDSTKRLADAMGKILKGV